MYADWSKLIWKSLCVCVYCLVLLWCGPIPGVQLAGSLTIQGSGGHIVAHFYIMIRTSHLITSCLYFFGKDIFNISLCVYVFQPVFLCVPPYVPPPIYPCFCPSHPFVCLFACSAGHLPVCPSMHLSTVHWAIDTTVSIFIHMSVCPFVFLSICLCVCPFACLFSHLLVHCFVCLSLSLSTSESLCPSVCLSFHLSVCPSTCPFVHLAVCLSIRLWILQSACWSIYLFIS